MIDDVHERLMAAALEQVEAAGLSSLSLPLLARSSGVSRATIYRRFPGGRDEILAELVQWEVRRFWRRVAAATADRSRLEDRLVVGLMRAHQVLSEHSLLEGLLAREADVLLPLLERAELAVNDALCGYIREMLDAEPSDALRPGLDLDEAAAYIANLARSLIASPGGWDMASEPTVRRVVRTHFVGGFLRR